MTTDAPHPSFFAAPDADASVRTAKGLLRGSNQALLRYKSVVSGVETEASVPMISDPAGWPVVALAPGPDIAQSLAADPAATCLLGLDPVLMLTGQAEPLDADETQRMEPRHRARHGEPSSGTLFYRLRGTHAQVQTAGNTADLTLTDLIGTTEDALAAFERGAVEHMNHDHLDAIELYAEVLIGAPKADWTMVSLDLEGTDLTDGKNIVRLWFDPPLSRPDEVRMKLVALVKEARTA